MLDITYLSPANQELHLTYDSYADFQQNQQACIPALADHYKVVKVTYKDKELDYQGPFGSLYFYLMKEKLD